MSGVAENEKGVKGWGQRDGQLRVMAYISHSLFNESHIDRAITPHTHMHNSSAEKGLLDVMAVPKSNCLKLNF